ncbi:MAG: twin-arginine translocation signal domain-containing protein [Candidatus Aminicenantes bacterium]|nr:twin-arginine translocation signal domain-containing protein [Candidatus Aminicenantes bacterium]
MKAPKQTRREFLAYTGCLGAMIGLGAGRLFSSGQAKPAARPETGATCQFRTVAVGHIAELKAWMDKLDQAGHLTANKTWRRYINSFQYAPPLELPGACSLIIMSTPLKNARIVFNAAGQKRTVMIPSGYVDDGLKLADYQNMLYDRGIVARGGKLARARLPLKQLAVRSGLAEYGRNNITYVDGYGSYHQLLAFYSEQRLEDHWGRLKMMPLCKGCSICLDECPTRAIRKSNFVIDAEKCITLYNELPDPLPDWIPAKAHNALVGCLKCQHTCPGNDEVKDSVWDLGEVDEAETALLLEGRADARTEASLRAKLQRIGGGDDLPYIARNLKLVLKAQAGI